jgi:hypothetical protein
MRNITGIYLAAGLAAYSEMIHPTMELPKFNWSETESTRRKSTLTKAQCKKRIRSKHAKKARKRNRI